MKLSLSILKRQTAFLWISLQRSASKSFVGDKSNAINLTSCTFLVLLSRGRSDFAAEEYLLLLRYW